MKEKKHKLTKLESLAEQYPLLTELQYLWRWRKHRNGKWQPPLIHTQVQVADLDTMHLQARNIEFGSRAYVERVNGNRGLRTQYVIAVDKNGKELGKLWWSRGQYEKYLKDIFDEVPEHLVSHLIWISAYRWCNPVSQKVERETDQVMGTRRMGNELDVIIFRKPKGKSFSELVAEAIAAKKEREEAYLYPPKEMPVLPGIEQALLDGCRIHAFGSGGGLRVVSISGPGGERRGYGEHPHVETALDHASQDYLLGGEDYKTQYGPKGRYIHYLTGATLPTSNIDAWVRWGSTFDAWREGEEVVFQLDGYREHHTPQEICNYVLATGQAVLWGWRGYTYKTSFSHFPNGDACTSSEVISRPGDWEARDAWFYKITKTGRGKNLWQAMLAAFEAPELEGINRESLVA